MKINKTIGKIFYYITWPGIFLIIKLQPPRTRVVIKCGKNILLVKDWLGTGKWSLPGGGLKKSEKPEIGAIREVYEETSLKLDPKNLISIGKLDLRSAGISYTAYCYSLNVDTKLNPSITSKEIAEVKWFNMDDLGELELSPTVKQVLQALYKRSDLLE